MTDLDRCSCCWHALSSWRQDVGLPPLPLQRAALRSVVFTQTDVTCCFDIRLQQMLVFWHDTADPRCGNMLFSCGVRMTRRAMLQTDQSCIDLYTRVSVTEVRHPHATSQEHNLLHCSLDGSEPALCSAELMSCRTSITLIHRDCCEDGHGVR